ncbi:hypothetical protein MMU07_04630 [Aquiflexum sp. LQ15W]|uniref:hypothetical protein n=1 Tax=Cognataquiflexum nitidum TaxID=2922272 RepID=UPI001F12F98E|nr:hypothetical protein [Cognataquiflexum nitidum]MCH6198850.1 hypothetical protein [Cognataquiflexum nitidum]
MEKTGTHVLQNNAYDFAYSKKEDFLSRGSGHLELFAWGGISGAYQQIAFDELHILGASLGYQIFDWGINGAIKKQFKGIKIDGSQTNKISLSYVKWLFQLHGL